MMASHSLDLNCLVLGDEPLELHVFTVKISNDKNVSQLRSAIKAEKKPTYDYICAHDLILWKVSITVDDVLKDTLEDLRFDASDDRVERLGPADKLSTVFSGDITPMSVQVIVQLPSSEPHVLLPSAPQNNNVQNLRTVYDGQYPTRSPSDQAAPRQFKSLQTKYPLPFTYCNRPASASSIPVTLLHPAFGRFVDECQSYVPTKRDNDFVHELSWAMSEIFPSELLGWAVFIQLVQNHYKIQLFAGNVGSTSYQTSGHVIAGGYMHFLTEAKDELGGGAAEPYFQGILCYRESIKSRKHADAFSVFPCFFIFYCGASFGFAGLACTDRPHMDMLGPILPLFCHRLDIAMKQTAARFFGATINAVRTLEEYYEVEIPRLRTMDPRSQPNPLFPYKTDYKSLTGLHAIQEFRYNRQYREAEGDRSKLLFFGETVEPSGEGKKLCIKFVRGYGMEAHRFCAEQGCAPALYGFEELPGGWYMVIMEELDSKVYRVFCDVDWHEEQRQRVRAKLLTCLRALHDVCMVHGDIRDINVFVGADDSIKLIDFDWAGKATVVQYPMNVNSIGIRRPETAFDGELVTAEHDLQMVDFMIPP